MSELRIREVDPASDAEILAWQELANDHMIAIREALGFVEGARTVELQKRTA
ncbi:hypothetical protein HNR19_003378 [Nocardioides thalensis]|uniref:Uncharacterized protein n=1 Tax=Nocardioides thalensis TaxID=1914755 RepID=A0A853C3E7_9ACTN|nr:hypothetical protein [Nocardioides thalensis]NYJ02680.1 hypothetical protein [Nocardioides thalensis]